MELRDTLNGCIRFWMMKYEYVKWFLQYINNKPGKPKTGYRVGAKKYVMSKKAKIQIVSITYKIGRRMLTYKPEDQKKEKGTRELSMVNKSFKSKNALAEDDGDFKCINGELHIKACVGSSCEWVPFGEPCNG